MEQYKPHPEHSHLLVYRDGRIYSTKTNKFVGSVNCYGYSRVLCDAKKHNRLTKPAHALVMQTWGTTAPEDMEDPTIDHIDENKLNNNIDNLQWLSRKDNARKGVSSNIASISRGSKHYRSKLSEQDIIEIRALRNKDPKFYTLRFLGELFSVGETCVSDICNRKRWAHI